ncbi:MAG: response regulator transcription factor [Candidatus Obscuribacter sp.]|jgi:NarL family two-component system response regulator LiaR|nr:response regulator transcription factor [Candidatus Obscuribacter sp.]MBK7836729.1 response regulator transcription factor [Candidatus Obscuribacter sp.]MBK9622727.1 response regulator transcription factor [Candidatus Obscuribacter sp.]MBK9772332.1 response regulator transcription factor [Candidatus Obscuribacter sp.]MDQ5967545.1 hypothetical protein [Cyanobacteriota bacterium erpe_2018_sw_39hr_WHONDRS-SW48-000098_B_bin.30]
MSEQSSNEPKLGIKVLLVEDHVLTRMGLKTALKRTEDITVIGEASNGEEAIERARALKPDVILMDVGMPVMDGIQAARHIVDESPDVRIIMLTQHDNDSDIMASLAAGASGYCLKDVEPERLYTAIRSVNAGDAWLDATIAGRVLSHYMSASSGLNLSDTAVRELNTQDLRLSKQAEKSHSYSEEHSPAAAVVESKIETKADAAFDRPAPEALSARELEVLTLIVNGLANQEIADKLFISLATTKTHVRNILNKLAVDDRTQAAVHAMRRGLV